MRIFLSDVINGIRIILHSSVSILLYAVFCSWCVGDSAQTFEEEE